MKNRARIGYEIFPDRFFSSSQKTNTLDWNTPVKRKEKGAHQFEFYGGDLKGISQKLGYLDNLGIDFIYLTPVFEAVTNHRYDSTDFFKIDPLLGDEKDLKELIKRMHERNMRLCFDGVFNHISLKHDWYKNRKKNDFILHKNGKPTMWSGAPGLPELNLDNKEVRDILWNDNNSVVKKWTSLGVDDWRLDCAYDIGYDYLTELTAALKDMGDHETIGEIWSYPGKWISDGVLDGVMNYYFRELIKAFVEGNIDGRLFNKMVDETVRECGAQNLLRSWNMLSSHDTPRLKRDFGKLWKPALVLQFTLPGSPLIYYGEELGLESDTDPYCRQPMPWDVAEKGNADLDFYKTLIKAFKSSKALHSGDFKQLNCQDSDIIAFSRTTDDIRDYRVIAINPTNEKKDVRLITKESSLMNVSRVVDIFTGDKSTIYFSMIFSQIEPHSFRIYKLDINENGYSPYKRV